jgi:membrane protease YdiL (CAAX protease family)
VPVGEEAAGRYALGAARLLGDRGGEAFARLESDARSSGARLRLVAVAAEIEGAAAVAGRLERLLAEDLSPAERADAGTFRRIYVDLAPLAPDADFVRRNGWFARLALSRGLPDHHPLRRAVLGAATRTFAAFVIAGFGLFFSILAGLVLLPMGLWALRGGRLRFAYAAPARAPGDRAWLETVTILLAGVLAIGLLGRGPLAIWLLVLVPLWPLARGVSLGDWRAGLGLVRGRGLVREAGAGLLGYLAGIPVFVAGVLVSVLLSRVLGDPLSHPAVREAAGGGAGILHLYLAACVWAPLVEETVFRGAFHRYLRARTSRLAAAALTGLVFAFVHPQGLAAVPALAAVGGWLALVREWRGSLVPCIAVHCVHNLALVSLAALALG